MTTRTRRPTTVAEQPEPVSRPTGRDIEAELAYLTRALKAPTLREAVQRLAERARAESWTHEEFLAACLQREVAARESHGAEGRIRAARFPAARAAWRPARTNLPRRPRSTSDSQPHSQAPTRDH